MAPLGFLPLQCVTAWSKRSSQIVQRTRPRPVPSYRRSVSTRQAVSNHLQDLTDREKTALERLYDGLVRGQRSSLAECITLVETQHPRKKELAQVLLQRVLAFRQEKERNRGGEPLAFRVGTCVSVCVVGEGGGV